MSPRAGLDTGAVVAVAARIADAEGLDRLTLARLAAEVGVRTPSLYNHVRGLDDLQRLLARRGLEELATSLAAATVGRARDDAVRALGHAYRRWAFAHPGRYAAAVRAPAPDDAEFQALARDVVAVVVAVLAGYGLEGDDALHATRALRSALHGFVSLEAAGGFGLPLDLDTSFDRLLDLVVEGLQP